MKVEANDIESLFKNAGKWEADLRALDRLIVKVRPDLERQFFDGMSIAMIAYGLQPYSTKTQPDGEWPVIALAPQKNYMSLYVCACNDEKYLLEDYAGRLGKAKCGKSCMRFTKLENLNLEVVEDLLKAV